ncbi:MAG: TerC family protein [Myxococcota bacterium]
MRGGAAFRGGVALGAGLWVLLLASVAEAGGGASAEVAGGGAFQAEAWQAVLTFPGLTALLTLAGLEIVLGIDNIVFITVLTARLPESVRPRARRLGLVAAMASRIVLLLFVGWLIQLTENLFQLPYVNADDGLSGKDLILLGGGAFLLFKAVREIHAKVNQVEEGVTAGKAAASFAGVLLQIMLVDLVFSLDSVITAVGMTANIPVMILAVVSSVLVMMVAANAIADFIERNPAIKILALAFLVLVGVLLIAEGFGQHIDKGYVYFAMAFALAVELLQIRMTQRTVATAS